MNQQDIQKVQHQVTADFKRHGWGYKVPVTTLGIKGFVTLWDFIDPGRIKSGINSRGEAAFKSVMERAKELFEEDKSKLLDSSEQCSAICKLLANVTRTKRINREIATSTWCHWAGELKGDSSVYGQWGSPSYGQFIAAAIHSGASYLPRERDHSFQAYFNLSSACMWRLRRLYDLNPSLFQRLVQDSADVDPSVRCDARSALATRKAFAVKEAEVSARIVSEYKARLDTSIPQKREFVH